MSASQKQKEVVNKRRDRKRGPTFLKYMCICHLADEENKSNTNVNGKDSKKNNKSICNELHRTFKLKLHHLSKEQKDGPLAKEIKTRVGFYRLPESVGESKNAQRQACLHQMGVLEEQIKSKDAYIARFHFPIAAFEYNEKRRSYILSKSGFKGNTSGTSAQTKDLPKVNFAETKAELERLENQHHPNMNLTPNAHQSAGLAKQLVIGNEELLTKLKNIEKKLEAVYKMLESQVQPPPTKRRKKKQARVTDVELA
eukprot:CAMPEP_0204849832 /NCGR_PEP_ID=MMETSP1347-20130617/6914_1 /ASSEMBLY_ACC=CAM_ASM_000690 /TAXON_ID=215587 /ORGANISM="Aplanochytrium stocchinoi, Strain GSBS06" /LENGTH=254 /DNA_ID=CAMNT_0051992361 /DNA_START=306 /DNA_END=1070 /DNA_ORIENTATION=+